MAQEITILPLDGEIELGNGAITIPRDTLVEAMVTGDATSKGIKFWDSTRLVRVAGTTGPQGEPVMVRVTLRAERLTAMSADEVSRVSKIADEQKAKKAERKAEEQAAAQRFADLAVQTATQTASAMAGAGSQSIVERILDRALGPQTPRLTSGQ